MSKNTNNKSKVLSDEEADKKQYALFIKRLQSLEHFCHYLEIPQFFLELAKQLLASEKINSKNLKEVNNFYFGFKKILAHLNV